MVRLLTAAITAVLVLCLWGQAMAECQCINCSADPAFVQRDLRGIAVLKLMRKYRDEAPEGVKVVRLPHAAVVVEPGKKAPKPAPPADPPEKLGRKQLKRLYQALLSR